MQYLFALLFYFYFLIIHEWQIRLYNFFLCEKSINLHRKIGKCEKPLLDFSIKQLEALPFRFGNLNDIPLPSRKVRQDAAKIVLVVS